MLPLMLAAVGLPMIAPEIRNADQSYKPKKKASHRAHDARLFVRLPAQVIMVPSGSYIAKANVILIRLSP